MDVLERERQRELGGELAAGDPLQLGRLPRRHERAAAKCVHHRPGLQAEQAGKGHGGGNRFGGEREPRVVHQLQPCPGPDLADPDRALAECAEQRFDTRTRLAGPGREDNQLAALGRIPTSRYRRVEERHVRTLPADHGRDAVDPRHADGAHLSPDRAPGQSSKHPLVPGDRDDGIGVGHHRDHDRGPARRGGRGLGDLRAELSQVPGRFHRAVPDDHRDASAQRTDRHPVAHGPNAEHRNRLVRPCHHCSLCSVCTSPPSMAPATRGPPPPGREDDEGAGCGTRRAASPGLVLLPGLLALDVASGQGLPPVKGSGLG